MTVHKPPPLQRSAWYAAAESAEVTRKPFRRIILDEPLVLFRTEDGDPVGLEDICCHRLAPLSPGQLIGDTIECPYHGLRFDAEGKCTHIPGSESIPARARVRKYPLLERYGFVWTWPGDPDLADPALVPDWRWAEDPDWSSMAGSFRIGCNFMLSVDNLMDLSHIGYVHKTTIGTASDGERAEIDTIASPDRITVRRWLEKQPPPPSYRKSLGRNAPVDRWQIIEFRPPCYVRTFKGFGENARGRPGYDFDSAESDPPEGALAVSRGNTCVTPETENSCHYFTVHCHYRRFDKDGLKSIWDSTVETLEQDIEILELTQKNIELASGSSMVYIPVDEGVEKARQIARMSARTAAD